MPWRRRHWNKNWKEWSRRTVATSYDSEGSVLYRCCVMLSFPSPISVTKIVYLKSHRYFKNISFKSTILCWLLILLKYHISFILKRCMLTHWDTVAIASSFQVNHFYKISWPHHFFRDLTYLLLHLFPIISHFLRIYKD